MNLRAREPAGCDAAQIANSLPSEQEIAWESTVLEERYDCSCQCSSLCVCSGLPMLAFVGVFLMAGVLTESARAKYEAERRLRTKATTGDHGVAQVRDADGQNVCFNVRIERACTLKCLPHGLCVYVHMSVMYSHAEIIRTKL